MNVKYKYSVVLVFTVVFISSCSLFGINTKRTAPKKADKYPIFTERDSLKGYLNENRSCFDVNYYDLDIDFNMDDKSIDGVVDIHFTAKRILTLIQLDLYENMNISKVVFEGQSLNYSRKYDAFFVTFNREIQKDENVKVSVHYNGKPHIAKKAPWDGGFVWKKDNSKEPWVGVACELEGASLWWPLKDHLSDEPDSTKMSFTVPQGLFCVSNGQLQSRQPRGMNKETFVWKVSNPINHYNISFYIGNYRTFQIPYVKDSITHQLTYYVLPQNLETAKSHFKQTNDMLHFYEEKFGDYQWFDDGYKLIESPFAGMEHQSAIAYGDKYKNNYNGFDYIILHETAHEWWGNSVSVGDFADIWLHEGFATYSEALYVEEISGYKAYLNYLYVYSLSIKNGKPMVGPRDVKYWTYKDGDPYVKGALTLHSLRSSINNDNLFFDILKTFHLENSRKIVSSDDFIALVNLKTGENYDWFFKQFLNNRKPPKYNYSLVYNQEKKTIVLYHKWVNVDADFKMPIDVYIGGKLTRVYPTSETQEIDLPLNTESFTVDKLNFYMTIEEFNFEDFSAE